MAGDGDNEVTTAVEAIRAHGFYIWEHALPPSFCDELEAEIGALREAQTPLSLRNDFHGRATERFYDLLNHGEAWQQLATHERLLPVIRAVLGSDALLNTYGTSIIGPGESAQPIHVDDSPFIGARNASPLRHRPRLPETGGRQPIVLNTMVALCDFTEVRKRLLCAILYQNPKVNQDRLGTNTRKFPKGGHFWQELGATRIVPDSNLLDYPRAEDSDAWMRQSVPALMPRGSILFFEGQCFHAGGANTTADRKRTAVSVDYCAGYLRTQENFMLSIPQERAAVRTVVLQKAG
jgi:ectoine hydroxylase-related dioxygenase (phytanoyl-CoA dioxygenase family)